MTLTMGYNAKSGLELHSLSGNRFSGNPLLNLFLNLLRVTSGVSNDARHPPEFQIFLFHSFLDATP